MLPQILFESTAFAPDSAQASLAPRLFWQVGVSCVLVLCFSLKPNPKPNPWFRKRAINLTLLEVIKLWFFLFFFLLANPRSLQDRCRLIIRQAVGKTRLHHLDMIPLSSIMTNYLKFKYDDFCGFWLAVVCAGLVRYWFNFKEGLKGKIQSCNSLISL